MADPATVTAGPGAPRRGLTLLAMCIAVFMAMLDNTIVNAALPRIQIDVGASVTGLQWVVDSYTLTFACLLLTFGLAGDRLGHRRLFLTGVVLFTVASALCAGAGSLHGGAATGALVAFRLLQGVAAAMIFPASLAIIRKTFPEPAERLKALGIWSATGGLAVTAGPILGGALVGAWGWRSVFLVNLPIGVIGYAVATRAVPRPATSRPLRAATGGLDVPGQLLTITGLGTLVFALIEGNRRGWTAPSIIGCFVVGVLSLVALAVVERRTRTPLLDRELLSGRFVQSAYVVTVALFFALFGVIFFATLYLQAIRGFSPLQAGLHLLPATASIGLTAPLAAGITRRVGPRPPVVFGLTLMAAAMIAMQRAGVDTPFGDYWWALMMLGLGAGSVLTPLAASVLDSVPEERSGVAGGTMASARELGGAIGVAASGAVLLARMQHALTQSLGDIGVPADQRASLAHRIVQGAIARSTAADGLDPNAPVVRLAKQAYVTGMHTALLVTACVLVVGALAALAWLRPPLLTDADGTDATVEDTGAPTGPPESVGAGPGLGDPVAERASG